MEQAVYSIRPSRRAGTEDCCSPETLRDALQKLAVLQSKSQMKGRASKHWFEV